MRNFEQLSKVFLLLATISLTPTTFGQSQAAQRPALPKSPRNETVESSQLRGKILSIQQDARTSASHAVTLSTASCAPTPTDLVAWFTLDEEASTVATDAVTGIAAQRRNSPTIIVGHVRNATQFDGRDDYIEIPGVNASRFDVGTQNLSFDAWVRLRPADSTNGVKVIVEKRQPNPLRGYSFYLYNGRPGIQLADQSGYTNYGADFTVPRDGMWHFIAATVDRSQPNGGVFYLDGRATGKRFDALSRRGNLDNSAPLRIGSTTLSGSPQSVFSGAIDELEILARVLTAEEVAGLAGAGALGKCTIQAIMIHLECEGKKADFNVTGYWSAMDAVHWAEKNCSGHSVTVSW